MTTPGAELLKLYTLARQRRRTRLERVLEALGMYTGLSEPVDFDQQDGTERVEKEPSSK